VCGVGDARVVRHRRQPEDGPDRVPAGADELGAAVEDVDLEVVDQEDAGQDFDRREIIVAQAKKLTRDNLQVRSTCCCCWCFEN